jgi:hypothetical protein
MTGPAPARIYGPGKPGTSSQTSPQGPGRALCRSWASWAGLLVLGSPGRSWAAPGDPERGGPIRGTGRDARQSPRRSRLRPMEIVA